MYINIQNQKDVDYYSLDIMLVLLKLKYTDDELTNIQLLSELIKKEFNIDISTNEIEYHYMIELEKEDIKLQLKHLGIL